MKSILEDILSLHPNINDYINEAQKTSQQYDELVNSLYGYNEASKAQQQREEKAKKQTLKAKEKEAKATEGAAKFLTGKSWEELKNRALADDSKVVSPQKKAKFKAKKEKAIKQAADHYDLNAAEQQQLKKAVNDPSNLKDPIELAKNLATNKNIPLGKRTYKRNIDNEKQIQKEVENIKNNPQGGPKIDIFNKLYFQKILEMISNGEINNLKTKSLENAFDSLKEDEKKKNIFFDKIRTKYKNVKDEQLNNIWNQITNEKNDLKFIAKFIAMPDNEIEKMFVDTDEDLLNKVNSKMNNFKDEFINTFKINDSENFERLFNNIISDVNERQENKNIELKDILQVLESENNGIIFQSIYKTLKNAAPQLDNNLNKIINQYGYVNSNEQNKILDARQEVIWLFLLWTTISIINGCINYMTPEEKAKNKAKKTNKNIFDDYINISINQQELYFEGPINWLKAIYKKYYKILSFKDLVNNYEVFTNYLKNIFTNNENLNNVIQTLSSRITNSNFDLIDLNGILEYGIDVNNLPSILTKVNTFLTNNTWIQGNILRIINSYGIKKTTGTKIGEAIGSALKGVKDVANTVKTGGEKTGNPMQIKQNNLENK